MLKENNIFCWLKILIIILLKARKKKIVSASVDSNKSSLADFVIVPSNLTSTITQTKDRRRGFPASPMGLLHFQVEEGWNFWILGQDKKEKCSLGIGRLNTDSLFLHILNNFKLN